MPSLADSGDDVTDDIGSLPNPVDCDNREANMRNEAIPNVTASANVWHIDIDSLPPEMPAGASGLVVFWLHDRPVGHAFLDGSTEGSIDMQALAQTAVLPAAVEHALRGAARDGQPKSLDQRAVSVVICTRDRAGELARCLDSLTQQTHVPDQIVVVDNASDDAGRTRDVAPGRNHEGFLRLNPRAKEKRGIVKRA